jgi:hypothetical protein
MASISQEHCEYFLYDNDGDIPCKIQKNILIDDKITTKIFKESIGIRIGTWKNPGNLKLYTHRIGIWEPSVIIGTGRWIILNEEDTIDFSKKPRIDIKLIREQ